MLTRLRLNEKTIRGLEPPAKGNRVYWDDEISGLGLRTTAAGVKAFVLNYRVDGRERRYTIGQWPDWNATTAREKAKALKRGVKDGIDPLAEQQERRGALTFGDVAAEYLAKHAVKKRSGDIDRQRLDRDVLPEWRNRKADSITKADTLRLVRAKAETAPVSANRLLALVRKIYNWAINDENLLQLEYNPCQVVAPTDEKHRKRKRVLAADEIRTFWTVLETGRYERENEKGKKETAELAMSADVRDVLRLVLILGQRPGEVAGMAWDEVDGPWWAIPEERAKNGRLHRVPLTAPACELLKVRARESRWVFPSPRGDKPIEVNALAHALRNNDHLGLPHFTPHDLRRTCSDWMARLKVDGRARSAVLNHKEAGVTEQHYTAYTFDDEKKAALDKWSRKLREILSGKKAAKVVSIG